MSYGLTYIWHKWINDILTYLFSHILMAATNSYEVPIHDSRPQICKYDHLTWWIACRVIFSQWKVDPGFSFILLYVLPCHLHVPIRCFLAWQWQLGLQDNLGTLGSGISSQKNSWHAVWQVWVANQMWSSCYELWLILSSVTISM